MVQFLHPKGPSITFYWPNRDDINFITFEDILCQITVLKPPVYYTPFGSRGANAPPWLSQGGANAPP